MLNITDTISLIIFGFYAQCPRLKPQIDIFGNQHYFFVGLLLHQFKNRIQDTVIILGLSEHFGSIAFAVFIAEYPQLAVAVTVERNPLLKQVFAGNSIHVPAILAIVHVDDVTALLEGIDLLQNGDGNCHIILLVVFNRFTLIYKTGSVENNNLRLFRWGHRATILVKKML